MKIIFKYPILVIALLLIIPQFAFAIGDQHGVFRSQSTQGDQWMGTATIEEEEFRITVHPNYLDVELDWTFRVGGTEPQEYKDALEIVGNLNLAKNSVIVGMITWWKGDILKGKLKTTENARSDYEEVVQRDADAPPPPRDPVLIEYSWGIDNYDISIFPATFGETRKVRLRYLVPANSIGGVVKMSYPHAFTQNAKVSIKAGPDIASYEIETRRDFFPFANPEMKALSSTDFSFSSYGSIGGGQRISYIVPKLANEPTGSRIYTANFSNTNLQGQPSHIVVMDAKKVIAQSNLKEDFVLLWRWNHTAILEKYAGQIVKQSKLLKAFLQKLSGSEKRAALIIDKDNGERVEFSLSKIGDPEHLKMIAYLDSTASVAVKEAVKTDQAVNYSLEADVEKAQSDFESALEAAMKLFDEEENIRHLLILTAGPQIITNNYTNISSSIDEKLNVAGFVNYAENFDLDAIIESEDRDIYWPGLNLGYTLNQTNLNLDIEATLTNGSENCTLAVAQSGALVSEVEKHVFSSAPLSPEVSWNLSLNGKPLTQFSETLEFIPVKDSLALAQIIGASRALIPMSSTLPRSMAAAVGFIDSSYSLVALEEDKLPAEIAIQYESAGVPHLLESDIYANSEDLLQLAAAEWIKENEPQKILTSAYTYSENRNWEFIMDDGLMVEKALDVNADWDVAVPVAAPGEVGMAEGEALMPMPQADAVTYSPSQSYEDYTGEVASLTNPENRGIQVLNFATLNGSQLLLDISQMNLSKNSPTVIQVFDLKGSLLFSASFSALSVLETITLDAAPLTQSSGLYLIKVQSGANQYQQALVIP